MPWISDLWRWYSHSILQWILEMDPDEPWPWQEGGCWLCGIMKTIAISGKDYTNEPTDCQSGSFHNLADRTGVAASMRYLSQRYTMPYKEVTATLTDIGTEELAHMEMICAIVHQLTKIFLRKKLREIRVLLHTCRSYSGIVATGCKRAPWTATYFQSKRWSDYEIFMKTSLQGATS